MNLAWSPSYSAHPTLWRATHDRRGLRPANPTQARAALAQASGKFFYMFFSRCGGTDLTTDCSLVAANLMFGSCRTLVCSGSTVWQLPNSGLAAAKLWFGGCQTWVWQLPNQSFGNEKLSLLMVLHYIRSVSMYFVFGFAIPLLSWHLVTLVQSMMK